MGQDQLPPPDARAMLENMQRLRSLRSFAFKHPAGELHAAHLHPLAHLPDLQHLRIEAFAIARHAGVPLAFARLRSLAVVGSRRSISGDSQSRIE